MNPASTPSLKRRLASMVYESMLMFGVIGVSGALFSILLQQRHALYLRHTLQTWLLLVVTAYFIWFWTHGGQTLAMKTWKVRLVDSEGQAVKLNRALGRYLLAWLWIFPGLALAWAVGAKHWLMVLIPALNMVLWALTIYLDPQRQFLHDRIAGTRIVRVAPSPTNAPISNN